MKSAAADELKRQIGIKRHDLAKLKTQLTALEVSLAIVQGEENAQEQLFQKELANTKPNGTPLPDSLPKLAYKILQETGHRMTASELLTQFAIKGKPVKKKSLTSSLYHYANTGKLFRVEEGAFALREWPK